MARNPSLVQVAPPSGQDNAPLVLIHDGSGTTVAYYSLPTMQRTVYAISNPYFFSGRAWSGGIPAMAKVYLELIRSVIPSGKFIIGGKNAVDAIAASPIYAELIRQAGRWAVSSLSKLQAYLAAKTPISFFWA